SGRVTNQGESEPRLFILSSEIDGRRRRAGALRMAIPRSSRADGHPRQRAWILVLFVAFYRQVGTALRDAVREQGGSRSLGARAADCGGVYTDARSASRAAGSDVPRE